MNIKSIIFMGLGLNLWIAQGHASLVTHWKGLNKHAKHSAKVYGGLLGGSGLFLGGQNFENPYEKGMAYAAFLDRGITFPKILENGMGQDISDKENKFPFQSQNPFDESEIAMEDGEDSVTPSEIWRDFRGILKEKAESLNVLPHKDISQEVPLEEEGKLS